MTKSLCISEARNKLLEMADELGDQPIVVAVTRRGKNVLAILPWEFYETLEETLDVLADEDLMVSLRRSLKEAKRGKIIPWEKAKKELEL